MVKNVLQVVYKEVRGLHQAAYILAFFTIGSQLLALVRDRLLAHQFGAGIELDLYYSAFRIPDLLYIFFASTLSVYVLIPFVADRINGRDATRARHLLSQIFTLFLIGYAALAVVIGIFAPFIVKWIFPGFIEQADELVLLIRLLLLQPFFLGISSLIGVITQFSQRFVLYAVSPLLYNIGIIVGILFLYPLWGLSGLVGGVVLGALMHLLIQLPYIMGSELRPRLTLTFSLSDIWSVLETSVPRVLTLSLHQLVLLGLTGLATVMAVGSVSVFQFAYNLQSVPLAVIGVSYSVAAFPLLAQLYAEEKYKEFSRYISVGLRHILFWSLPVVALLIVIRAQFVRVILGSGAFDWNDTRLTAAVFAIFLVSLAAQAVHMFVVRALYASGSTRLPFLTTLFSSIGALLFSFYTYTLLQTNEQLLAIFKTAMRLEGVSGVEVLALPLGYTIAVLINAVVLLILARSQLMLKLSIIGKHCLHSIAAALVGGVTAYATLNFFVFGLKTETTIGIFVHGLLAGIAGLFGVVFTYYVLRTPELNEVYRAFHKRLFKTNVVVPQDEDHLSV